VPPIDKKVFVFASHHLTALIFEGTTKPVVVATNCVAGEKNKKEFIKTQILGYLMRECYVRICVRKIFQYIEN